MLLAWAARLHEIGLVISHSSYHKHGEYIIKHCDLQGFSQTDQKLLATLVRAHRSKLSLLTFDDFVQGVENFGRHIQPKMKCRQHITVR